MRAALIALLSLTVIACSKESASDEHLTEAGAEAKAAAADVGKAINESVPAIKQAGAQVGDGIKDAGAEAAPEVKAAGQDIKDAAHKAGDEIKSSAEKAKEKVQDKG